MSRRPPERKVVLLTGASVGLGLAIARLLNQQDELHLVLTARASSLPRFAEAGLVPSARLWLRELDITSDRQRAAVVGEIEHRLGGVDVLINNAGIAYRTVAEYATAAELTHQMAVNYEGPMALTALVLPSMRNRRKGRVIQISSAGGLVAMPTMGLYAASKFALEAASEAMYYEVKPFGIQVSLVLPGFVRSSGYLNAIVGLPSRRATDDQHDAYHPHFKHMDRFIHRLMNVTRASPESVANRIVKLMRRRRAPLRLLATWDATLLWWFRRFTPQPLYVWLTYNLLPGIRDWAPAGVPASTKSAPRPARLPP